MERDPVCGVRIESSHEQVGLTHRGRRYGFCSAECRAIFEENRAAYPGASWFDCVRFLWQVARDAGPVRTLKVVGTLVCGIILLTIVPTDTAVAVFTTLATVIGAMRWLDRQLYPRYGCRDDRPPLDIDLPTVVDDHDLPPF